MNYNPAPIVARGPATVTDGVCGECGRDYQEPDLQGQCPADDCPSHWERVGLKFKD